MSATGEIVAVRPKGCPSYNSTSPCLFPSTSPMQPVHSGQPSRQSMSKCCQAACLTTKLIALHAHATGHSCHSRLISPCRAVPCPALPRCSKSRAKTRVCHIKFPCQLAATCAAQWHQLWQTNKNQLQLFVTSCPTRLHALSSS